MIHAGMRPALRQKGLGQWNLSGSSQFTDPLATQLKETIYLSPFLETEDTQFESPQSFLSALK